MSVFPGDLSNEIFTVGVTKDNKSMKYLLNSYRTLD